MIQSAVIALVLLAPVTAAAPAPSVIPPGGDLAIDSGPLPGESQTCIPGACASDVPRVVHAVAYSLALLVEDKACKDAGVCTTLLSSAADKVGTILEDIP